jgi:dipeptidyl aminopeptidase/acylaminoacyl peptidase
MQYRRAGGQVELALFEGEGEGFLTRTITSPAAQQALEQLIAFVHQHIG